MGGGHFFLLEIDREADKITENEDAVSTVFSLRKWFSLVSVHGLIRIVVLDLLVLQKCTSPSSHFVFSSIFLVLLSHFCLSFALFVSFFLTF